VVKLIGSDFTQHGLNLVNDYAKGGTISDFLETRGTNGGGHALEPWVATSAISQKLAFRIMRELADGLKQLHDHNVPHSDLKDENLLLMGDPESWESKDPLVMFAVFGASSNSADQEKNDIGHVFRVMMQAASLTEDGEAFGDALQAAVRRKLTSYSDNLKLEDLVEIVKELEQMVSFVAEAASHPLSPPSAPSAAERGWFDWLRDAVVKKYGLLTMETMARDNLKSKDLVEDVKKPELMGSLAADAASPPSAPSVAGGGWFNWLRDAVIKKYGLLTMETMATDYLKSKHD
jgi:serine/threonine protein kinase